MKTNKKKVAKRKSYGEESLSVWLRIYSDLWYQGTIIMKPYWNERGKAEVEIDGWLGRYDHECGNQKMFPSCDPDDYYYDKVSKKSGVMVMNNKDIDVNVFRYVMEQIVDLADVFAINLNGYDFYRMTIDFYNEVGRDTHIGYNGYMSDISVSKLINNWKGL